MLPKLLSTDSPDVHFITLLQCECGQASSESPRGQEGTWESSGNDLLERLATFSSSFPVNFPCRKPAGKIENCSSVTMGYCNHCKGKLIAKDPDHNPMTVGVLRSLRNSGKYHLISIIVTSHIVVPEQWSLTEGYPHNLNKMFHFLLLFMQLAIFFLCPFTS